MQGELECLGVFPKRSVTFSVTSCCSTEVTKPSAACTDSPLSEVAVTDPLYWPVFRPLLSSVTVTSAVPPAGTVTRPSDRPAPDSDSVPAGTAVPLASLASAVTVTAVSVAALLCSVRVRLRVG